MSVSCLSDAMLIASKENAETDRVLAEAEKTTASWSKRRNDFITSLKKINVYDKLADNEDLIFNTSSDESTSLLAVADNILEQQSSDSDALSPTSVAAEVALLRQLQTAGSRKKHDLEKLENIKEKNT